MTGIFMIRDTERYHIMPRIADCHHKLKEVRRDPPLGSFREKVACSYLGFRLLASRTVSEPSRLFKSHSGFCYFVTVA